VLEAWGLAGRSGRGAGITALFSGPSGTGKTLAAEVIANALHLALWRVDLSSVVSKYIGETEKNLGRLFDAADGAGVVLLFDEADALFARRGEVQDAHDRNANLEVGYLLQRMEDFNGLAILTTNMADQLDGAFQRRIRAHVRFAFPDAAQRAALWLRVFPEGVPTEGLDPERLAQLQLSGAGVRAVATRAAFRAARRARQGGAPAAVTMDDLREAAIAELAQQGRPVSERELRGWG
jgi:SpoVK/Ycf46/Vps4 family AAA+-type ATPase